MWKFALIGAKVNVTPVSEKVKESRSERDE
jgi:hypothetical protein